MKSRKKTGDLSGPIPDPICDFPLHTQLAGNAAAAAAISLSQVSTWIGPYLEMCAALQATPESQSDALTGLIIVTGDPHTDGVNHVYTPGMTPPTGANELETAFAADVVSALDALIYGLPINGETGTEPTHIADVDFSIFNTLENQRSDQQPSPIRDPNVLRNVLNSPARYSPGAQLEAQRRSVPVHGNVVLDYLPDGKLSNDRVYLVDARFHHSGKSCMEEPNVYWAPRVGSVIDAGQPMERRAPPMMVLKHELHHAWMDSYFSADKLWADNDAQDVTVPTEQQAEWKAFHSAYLDRRMQAIQDAKDSGDWSREASFQTLPVPRPQQQTPYTPDVYNALIETAFIDGTIPHSDWLLIPPSFRDQAPYRDVHQGSSDGPGYYEEEVVTDNEYLGTAHLEDWIRQSGQESLLAPDGELQHLGNRTQYSQNDTYVAAGPLTTRRAK